MSNGLVKNFLVLLPFCAMRLPTMETSRTAQNTHQTANCTKRISRFMGKILLISVISWMWSGDGVIVLPRAANCEEKADRSRGFRESRRLNRRHPGHPQLDNVACISMRVAALLASGASCKKSGD